MKCPLRLGVSVLRPDDKWFVTEDCLQGGCAWWEQDVDMCAVKEMALETRYTQRHLAELTRIYNERR
jgi:hypothetical protein